jgi:pyruvate kinase
MNFRHSKIVCTIGPASRSPKMIDRLLDAGMDVARLNFSHGTHEEHAKNISTLRAAAVKHQKPIAILTDLQGPKIRTGPLAGGGPVRCARPALSLPQLARDSTRMTPRYATAARSPPWRPHPAFRWID